MKYFKIIYLIVLLLLTFCVNFKTAYAFFSPSTFQLLSASIGAAGQVIVVLITAIIALGIRIKRGKIKRILLTTLLSVLFVCVGIIGWRFYELKKLNSMLLDNHWLNMLGKYALEHEAPDIFIDLNQINRSGYDEFKKIGLNTENIRLINTDFQTSIFDLREFMLINKIKEFLSEHNITKKDKLLLYCNVGWSSRGSAFILNELGYNAYYTRLNQLKNKDYIESSRFPLTGKSLPIIVPLKEEKNDKNYILFMFHGAEDEFCNPEIYSSEIRSKLKKLLVWPQQRVSKKNQLNIPEVEFNEIFNKYSKIVCLAKIDCILTQHYLDYLNLTNEFKRVFFIPQI